MLTISLVSDIHHGIDAGTKRSSAAELIFKRFIEWHSKDGGDLVVDLGDKITATTVDEDRKLLVQVRDWFSTIKEERFHILGNMEVRSLSVEENSELFNYDFTSKSIDREGFHLVFWNANTKLYPDQQAEIEEENLKWLERDLASANLPVIIFSHFPLDNGSFRGHYYFEERFPKHACYGEESGRRIRKVLENSDKVLMCINGHAHWNTYQAFNGIHYITVPSFTDTFPTYPQPTAAWTKIEIDSNVRIEVFGNLPMVHTFSAEKLVAYPQS